MAHTQPSILIGFQKPSPKISRTQEPSKTVEWESLEDTYLKLNSPEVGVVGIRARYKIVGPKSTLQAANPIHEFASQFHELKTKVAELASELETLKSNRNYFETSSRDIKSSNYLEWCEKNRKILSNYNNEFVAIDISSGKIVVHANEQNEFAKLLSDMDPSYVNTLYTIHTSQFI